MCKGKPTEVHGPMPPHLINVRCHRQLLTTGSPGSPSDGLLSGDSLPHSSLPEPSLVIPQGRELKSEGVSSFVSNCPAVFVIPMGMPVSETKQDMVSSTLASGVESMTQQTEEDVVAPWE